MTNDGWGFEIERVDLNGLNINAEERLRMVFVQPEYELVPDGVVPFRISAGHRESQKELIKRAFKIRAIEIQEHNVPIPFIVFPELSIPVNNPNGLDYLHQQIEQAQGDVIFIGGLEGLSLQEANDVISKFPSADSAPTPSFVDGTFVNMCVIAIKLAGGQLNWYFQAKLRPSQWEQSRNMARGQRVLYFSNHHVAFICQICFDHIAMQSTESLNTVLCRKLIETSPLSSSAPILDFVFVLQHNPRPDKMNEKINDLFIERRGLQNRSMTVVSINKAASEQESSEYGRSGCHYRNNLWKIATSDIGPMGYELYDLENVTSAIFRKRTHGIHVITFIHPSLNAGESGNLSKPFENPRTYLITDGCDTVPCSCLPGSKVADEEFVVCKCLPCKLRDILLEDLANCNPNGRWNASSNAQKKNLEDHYKEVRKDLFALSCERAGELLDLLLFIYDEQKANPDTWEGDRRGAVVEFSSALCVLREWRHSLVLNTKKEWNVLLDDTIAVVIMDGEDRKCDWTKLKREYWKGFENYYFNPDLRKHPILFVALRSQGEVGGIRSDNCDWTEREHSDGERMFTEPMPINLYVCKGDLLEEAQRANSIKDFMDEKWDQKL